MIVYFLSVIFLTQGSLFSAVDNNSCIISTYRDFERFQFTFPQFIDSTHIRVHFTTEAVDSIFFNDVWFTHQSNLMYATTVLEQAEYAYSVYLKANASNFGFIGQYDGSNYNGIVVNLSTGAITDTSGSVTSSSVEDVGSGWYRLKCVKTFSAVTSYILISLSDSGTPSYTSGRPNFAGTTESIYVWGIQVEKASSVTGYLPTTSASLSGLTTVTRGVNGTTAQSASSGDAIQQLPYALSEVDMPIRLKGISVSSDGTGAGRFTLCDKIGTTLCDIDIPDTRIYDLDFGGGIIFPNGVFVSNSDNITGYTLYTDKYSGGAL